MRSNWEMCRTISPIKWFLPELLGSFMFFWFPQRRFMMIFLILIRSKDSSPSPDSYTKKMLPSCFFLCLPSTTTCWGRPCLLTKICSSLSLGISRDLFWLVNVNKRTEELVCNWPLLCDHVVLRAKQCGMLSPYPRGTTSWRVAQTHNRLRMSKK